MAGGKGERFWPLSTSKTPKQVLTLFGDKSLLAEAVDRISPVIPPERVFVITSADLAEITRNAAPRLPAGNVIGEPMGRDTAAAVACGLALVKGRAPDGAFAVLTADHIIRDDDIFRNTVEDSLRAALESDILMTIGIQPSFASTGFGYIEAGEIYPHESETAFNKAVRFVEKPDEATAESYVASGNYFWNSGMFIWSVKSLETAFRAHRPALYELVQRLQDVQAGPAFEAALGEEYPNLDKISIDYALMEKADNIVMARGVFEWHDVGAWPAVADHFPVDDSGNVIRGQCENVDSSSNIVVSEGRLTALLGVQDLVVIQAEGATLICPRERAQDVKQIVALLKEKGGYDQLL
jgi:mannose-1-phosphate guanylyltransferase